VAAAEGVKRLALVVHPRREIGKPLEILRRWAERDGVGVVQIPSLGAGDREVAERGELEAGDLVVALGGDGTVLSALRAAAPEEAPVMGVACGSLGALTSVHADELEGALERVRDGDWQARKLPALAIKPDGGSEEWGVNDFVAVRSGAGQLLVDVHVHDELYVRLAGDGLVVASPLGSSAYSMAAGGPVLVTGTPAVVCTPIAMHGGNAPPLVVPATADLRVELHPTMGGFDIEIDGHSRELDATGYGISIHEERVSLVSFGDLGLGLTSLRGRKLIIDSPRVLARDERGGG
jgi:NAD+ kinase